MKINKQTGLLDSANYIQSPNHDDRPNEEQPSLLVIHNISLPPNEFGGEGIHQLFTNTLNENGHPFYKEISHLNVSSHLLIRRGGKIFQYVPFHLRAWHAGVSCFKGRETCNDFSIGIEMEGTDEQPFEKIQYETLIKVIDCLIKHYPSLSSNRIAGHEHIAPGRKTDPGAFFKWEYLEAYFKQSLPTNCD